MELGIWWTVVLKGLLCKVGASDVFGFLLGLSLLAFARWCGARESGLVVITLLDVFRPLLFFSWTRRTFEIV